MAETYVRRQNLESFAGKDARWRGQRATLKQSAIIRGFGKSVPEELAKEKPSEIIERG